MRKENPLELPLQKQEKESSAPEQPVECLCMTFADDQERRNYFLAKLSTALQELREKLEGVPFSSLQDTTERLESLQHWPFGHDSQVQELAKKMAEAAGSKHRENPDQEHDLLQLFKDEIGFPHGQDEDILALSDPPYYTACPNPFISEFIKQHAKPYDPETDDYHREPFATDVSEGKNDPIYNAHSYHTKVPHKAIMRYILHYTEPGDMVFDGFCGTGMTGVAAQLCADRETVESLGYYVDKQGNVFQQENGPDGKATWKHFSKLGSRTAVLNDLSPAATFIAYNYNSPVDVKAFEREAKRILNEVEQECGWMYTTLAYAVDGSKPASQEQQEALAAELAEKLSECKSFKEIRNLLTTKPIESSVTPVWGQINYTVWSDDYICPECAHEVIFWEAAVDKKAGKVQKEFPCPGCNVQLTKRNMDRAWVTKLDNSIGKTIRQAKQLPVLINYSVGKKRYEKSPDVFDQALIGKIEELGLRIWIPTNRMPEGEESRRNDDMGITHVHHFFTKRNMWILGKIYEKINKFNKGRFKNYLTVWFTASQTRLHKMNRYMAQHKRHVGPLSGTLYISSTMAEISPIYFARSKIKDHKILDLPKNQVQVTTKSASLLDINSTYVDYIFVDPPFGGNLMYSELNFIWESWLRMYTNNYLEVLENQIQNKTVNEYQHLMSNCFAEYYRLLKPGRWMTVEFHKGGIHFAHPL